MNWCKDQRASLVFWAQSSYWPEIRHSFTENRLQSKFVTGTNYLCEEAGLQEQELKSYSKNISYLEICKSIKEIDAGKKLTAVLKDVVLRR